MEYRYKVIPFIGQSKGSLSPRDVATQLEAAIAQHATEGWEFYQISDVNIEVQPGCIAGLFGAQTQYARFDQLIFRSHEIASATFQQVTPLGIRESAVQVSSPPDQPAEALETALPDEPVPEPPPAGASKLVLTWWRKTDEELREAVATIGQYTEDARQVILAEVARRELTRDKERVR